MSTIAVTNLKNPSAASAAITLDTSGNAAAPSLAPPGTVQFYAANTAPAGWVKANGAALSRTTYAALFAAIGTTFGAGDGSTTFNLPDMRGEFPRGWDDGRGVDTGRAIGTAQVASRIGFFAAFGGDVDVQDADQTFSATRSKYSVNNNLTVTSVDHSVRPRNVSLLAIIKF
jgi:microcystin-dependent protein